MKTIYLGLDYDNFSDVFSDEMEEKTIKDALEQNRLSPKAKEIFHNLAQNYEIYRDPTSPVSDLKKTVANFINDQYKQDTQNKPLKKGLLFLCHFLEIRRILLEKLKSFAKRGDRVIILTTSLRQSKEKDEKLAACNHNGSCEKTLTKLAAEQGWKFDPICFPETGTDHSKISILRAHFNALKSQEQPGGTSEFYLLDDLYLKELRQFFQSKPKEILDNMTFFLGQFNWVQSRKYVQFMQCEMAIQLIPNRLQKNSHIASTHAQVRSAFTKFAEDTKEEVSTKMKVEEETSQQVTSWFPGITGAFTAASSFVKTLFGEEQVENQDSNEDCLENRFPKLRFKF